MRKQKYRAYIKHLQLMLDVNMIDFENEFVFCYLVSDEEGDLSEFSFSEIELLQYIGLQDKNGVDVYEGDIICTHAGADTWVSNPITFHSGSFVLDGLDSEDNNYDLLAKWVGDDLEVIGNIHEDPELLRNP